MPFSKHSVSAAWWVNSISSHQVYLRPSISFSFCFCRRCLITCPLSAFLRPEKTLSGAVDKCNSPFQFILLPIVFYSLEQCVI